MLAYIVLTMSGFWICLVTVSQGFEYAPGSLVLNSRAGNMERLWICKICTGYWICLKCLNMCEYALIMLNMFEYAWIYWNKQSSDYARIQNVSVAEDGIRSLYKLLNIYRDRHIQNIVKHLRWSILQKE